MRDLFAELLRPLLLDESLAFVAVYRVDGTPVFVKIRQRGILNVLYWLEDQVKVLLHYIESEAFSDAEIRIGNFRLFMYPISRSLVVCVLADESVSLYKLRIDLASIKKNFEKYG